MAVEGIKIIPKGEIAILEWDLAGEKVNKLSTPVMNHLDKLLEELKTSSYKAVVMISRKPKIFIAGADINEIVDIKEKNEAKSKAAGGEAIMNKIEDLPMPVIAAISGACLGGGCEMVMACDYRLASDDKATQIGLPETKLGIIPGFGGCVRMPRIIGLQASLDIILGGKSVDGKKAAKLGLVDAVVPSNQLEKEALKMAAHVAGKKRRKTFSAHGAAGKFLESFIGRPIVFSQARKGAMKMTKGKYPAITKALDVVQKTYGMSNRAKALDIEAEGFSEVAITDVSKYLINLFFMTEAIKKQNGVSNPNVKIHKVEHMAVLGAGTMGGGIAQLAADKGIEVRVKDISQEALSKAFVHAQSIWKKKVEQRRMDKYEFKKKMDLITGGLDYAGFKRLDLVVEAIVEDMNIKKKVIGETAANCSPDCIIATNTSSLSVTEMSKGHPNPAQFVGMHFFNPVHKMPLVEVIRGEKTSDETTATIFELVKKMGKIPVVVKDGPGFIVNRLLLPYLNEAVYLFAEGYSVEDIDKAYLNFGMPMGPLRLLDEVGIDVSVKVSKVFHESFGERAKPHDLMKKLADHKDRLGVKSGKGFYLYDEKGKPQGVDPKIYSVFGLSQPTKKASDPMEMVHRGIFAMINEAALAVVGEHIVETAQECDLAMIMGTGFPPFRGGLLKYADSVGTDKIADELEVFTNKYGPRFKPSQPLLEMAKTKKKFY